MSITTVAAIKPFNAINWFELPTRDLERAVGFYERNGWRLASPEFEIPTAGPHHKMTRHLEEA